MKKYIDYSETENIPHVLYVILWRDKHDKNRQGIYWANGGSPTNPMPFASFDEATREAERMSFRQETKILEWHLEITSEITKSIESKRKKVLSDMKKMSTEELFQFAVKAGIYNEDGTLTAHYKNEEEMPSDDKNE